MELVEVVVMEKEEKGCRLGGSRVGRALGEVT